MASQVLTYVLWVFPTLLQGILGLILWRRKLSREFPFFYWYTVMHVVRSCSLMAIYELLGYRSASYFFVYWGAEALDAAFQIAVIYEIYLHVFRPYEALSNLGKSLFRWSLVALLLMAVASATTAGSEIDALRAGALTLHQATIVVSGGLLLLLFIFAASFGLTWRQRILGIAAGLCLGNSVELAVTVGLSHWGAIAASTSSLMHAAAYNCSVLVWTWSFLRREAAPDVVVPLPGGELEKWNEALAELLNR